MNTQKAQVLRHQRQLKRNVGFRNMDFVKVQQAGWDVPPSGNWGGVPICVEVARKGGQVAVRDSKREQKQGSLMFDNWGRHLLSSPFFMKKTITILVLGLLADIKSPLLGVKNVIVFGTDYKNDGINDTVKHFEKLLEFYPDCAINLISHSSGSEIILRSELPSNVKKWTLWSPALLYPQNIASTLSKKGKYLVYENRLICKKIARDMDNCDTAKLLPRIKVPITICSSKEGTGWSKYYPVIQVPYEHNYTNKEIMELYNSSK